MKIGKIAYLLTTVTLASALVVTGCGSSSSSSGGNSGDTAEKKEFKLKLGHVGPADVEHPWEKYSHLLAEQVAEKTDGQIKIDTFPGSQLGGDREMVEGMQQGTIDMGLIGTIAMSNFVPELQVWDLPYIFPVDNAKADEITDGPIGDELAKKMEEKGLVLLAYWDHSWRSMSNSKRPIKSIDDMKGLKMRVVENKSSIGWFSEVGSIPTPMAFSELYTGLQQGTVDGQDNGPILTFGSKLHEVQPYYTYTKHIYSVLAVIVSKKTWDKLPEDARKELKDAAMNLREEQRKYSRQVADNYGEEMKKAGVEVIELSDEELKRFQDSAVPIYDQLKGEIGEDLVNKMLEYRK